MRQLIFCLIALVLGCEPAEKRPFSSNLKVGKEDPFYTTYAAAMPRAQFSPDQGYALSLHQHNQPLRMRSQRGGNLGLDILHGGKLISRPEDMFSPPTLTLSYPDYAEMEWQAVEGLQIKNKTWVYSSRAILQEYVLENTSGTTLSLSLLPSMENSYRPFREPALKAGSKGLLFQHENYPDGWTLNHALPYSDSIINHWIWSEPADAWAGFDNGRDVPHSLPFSIMPEKSPVFQLQGRILDAEGQRVLDRPPHVRMLAWFKDQPDQLITHQSPIHGLPEPAVNTDGYFRMELGHLGEAYPGRAYQVNWWHEPSGSGGTYTETVAEDGKVNRRDLKLGIDQIYSHPVSEIRSNDGYTALSFTQPEDDWELRIYERTYPEANYHYLRTADGERFVLPLNPDTLKGYILIPWNLSLNEPGIPSKEYLNLPQNNLGMWLQGSQVESLPVYANRLSAKIDWTLEPGASRSFRMLRFLQKPGEESPDLQSLLDLDMQQAIDENKALLSGIPPLDHPDKEIQHLYYSAWNMMRQQFYPPEAKSSYNYYVFSREPTWGWGHGGQVFHESLTMMAYAWMDPQSAMNSQRVYAERQYENGYINYRTGSYLDEIIEYNGQLTSSAPWYAWINWEVYLMTKDKAFLEEMYSSSKRFYEFYVANRDADGDGLCEWGGHAVLESVRDALVAVWDEVNWPSHFEAVDLNSMLVMEAKALEAMARELGLEQEAEGWKKDHEQRAQRIRDTFWDEETGFYYHVDRDTHTFSHKAQGDLKRMEIIGFLPLWAGVATDEQASQLLEHLKNPEKFWRPYGIPSLAADDPYYNDKGYWNGPVWVEWNYLIQRGLQNYGYDLEAAVLVDKVAEGMVIQLKENHNLWEFYSPDEPWAGYHKTYIWAGIINRMLKDVEHIQRP